MHFFAHREQGGEQCVSLPLFRLFGRFFPGARQLVRNDREYTQDRKIVLAA
jgi:hypothetical protein